MRIATRYSPWVLPCRPAIVDVLTSDLASLIRAMIDRHLRTAITAAWLGGYFEDVLHISRKKR